MTDDFSWQDDPVDVFSQMVDEYVLDIRAVIQAVMLRFEPEIEAWMKENAGWNDQTGNLRQTLYSLFYSAPDDFFLIADYKLWYGVFLELANAGRYAVVAPAIDTFAPRIFQAIREALG